jgi:NAD+ diphosphatase
MNFCPKCGNELTQADVNGEMRQVCSAEACDYVFWNNPTPVVAAIVEIDGAVVLTRNKGWPAHWHGIVAGFLEAGETPEAGVLREIKEELGLDATIVDFIGYYSFFEKNQLILAFHGTADGDITVGEELESVKLVSPDELRPWSAGTGPAVRDWLANR